MNEILLPLHIGILVATGCCVVFADIYASQWLRGNIHILNAKIVSRLHQVVSIGTIGMITTGIALFVPVSDFLVQSQTFFIKMTFVLALVVNSFVIEKHMNIATTQAFTNISQREKIVLFVSGTISSVSWLGALISAFFLFS